MKEEDLLDFVTSAMSMRIPHVVVFFSIVCCFVGLKCKSIYTMYTNIGNTYASIEVQPPKLYVSNGPKTVCVASRLSRFFSSHPQCINRGAEVTGSS